jgi:hypothetical protein
MEEIWQPLHDYPIYAISNYGKIKNTKTNDLKHIRVNDYGYCQATIYDHCKAKSVSIHNIVAKMFVSNPYNYHYVKHIDGNKANNTAANLEWIKYNHVVKSINDYIVQYDKDYNFIGIYDNVHQAGSLSGVYWKNIEYALKGNNITNFLWYGIDKSFVLNG